MASDARSSGVPVADSTGVPVTTVPIVGPRLQRPTSSPPMKARTASKTQGAGPAPSTVTSGHCRCPLLLQMQSGSRGNSGQLQVQIGVTLPARTTKAVEIPRASSDALARRKACIVNS